jgi:hypothetical protein
MTAGANEWAPIGLAPSPPPVEHLTRFRDLCQGGANEADAGAADPVRFDRTGRYLVICMNRSHLLNDHMFGFVNVVGEDAEQ